MATSWTDSDDALIRVLWKDGQSASAIAKRLAGRTRCSVLGRLFRLGLSNTRATSRGRTQLSVKMVRGRAKVFAPTRGDGRDVAVYDLPLPEEPTPPPLMVSFEDLEAGMCRFPFGTMAPFGFCGCPSIPGASYCASHYAKTYTRYAPKVSNANRERNATLQRIAEAKRILVGDAE